VIDMAKAQGKITKLDLGIPNDLYAQIEEIAIEEGAKVHHISKKPTLTPTAIKLLEEAIEARKNGLTQVDEEPILKAQTLVIQALEQITIQLSELGQRSNRQIILGRTRLGNPALDRSKFNEAIENMKRERQKVSPQRKRSEGFPVDSLKRE
jgi:hypothetical protein